jgi:hypothetical protein
MQRPTVMSQASQVLSVTIRDSFWDLCKTGEGNAALLMALLSVSRHSPVTAKIQPSPSK